jgi:hypothetical protein
MPAPLLLAILAAVVVASFLYYWRRQTSGEGLGFLEVVKNPSLWRRMIHNRQDVELDIAAAADWDDARIAREVRTFVFSRRSEREAWREKKVLESLGRKMHGPVLAILRDESTRERLVKANSTNLFSEAPFNRACALLEDDPPLAAIEALSVFADHPDEGIRQDIGLVVGATGVPEMLPLLRRVLSDRDDTVSVRGLIGLRRAEEKGRLDWRCKQALVPDLQKMIVDDRESSDAAKLLFDFDAEAATAFFLSAPIFRVEKRALGACLSALARKGVVVPRARLLELLPLLEQGEIDYKRRTAIEAVLVLPGQQRDPADLSLLTARMNTPTARSREEGPRVCSHSTILRTSRSGFGRASENQVWIR